MKRGPSVSGPSVLLLFDIHPERIDGTAMFARAMSVALGSRGCLCILCFPSRPVPIVEKLLALPNVIVETAPELFSGHPVRSGLAFVSLILRHRPQVVHLHFMRLISLLPWLARMCGVAQVIFTDHGSRSEHPAETRRGGLRGLARTLLSRPIDHVVVVSDYLFQSQLALGLIGVARLRKIDNGIDVERALEAARAGRNFRAHYGIPADLILVTQVSWLIEEKGISDFVDAAMLVLSECSNVHFCLAGTGPCLERQKREVSRSGRDARFTFAGPLSDPFFDGVFSATDILCQPSRWQEAFGWVLGEAMVFGKAVVATRVGGIPGIVHDGVTGFLVAPRDTAALSRRLMQLVSDAALRERMGAEGFRVVVERFALEDKIKQHLELYGIAWEA